MPVPVPRQRAIPAVESGQAHATSASAPGGSAMGSGPASAAEPVTQSVAESVAESTVGSVMGSATRPAVRPAVGSSAGGPSALPVKDPAAGGALTLLLIEDDPGGSAIVPELLDSAGQPIRVRTARNLTEAGRLLTDDVHCILLDLALSARGAGSGVAAAGTAGAVGTAGTPGTAGTSGAPGLSGPSATTPATSPASTTPTTSPTTPADPDELAVLRHVLELAPRHAVLALTASGDSERGAEAVRVGAQDYLFRDELDGRLLSRAIRYAVERKRSDSAERRLAEGRLRAQENARLERGLLPTPLLEGSSLRFAARYRPGRSRALLGGDFYDIVRTPDGTVHAMIGDVCGHGPDEAALGVALRIAWRALTFAGLCGDELLGTLQQVLVHERNDDEIFATLCTVDIAPDARRAGLCLAGHPAPLIARAGRPAGLLPQDNNGPALGLLPGARWPRMQVELGREWSLMLYTDGLIEGRIGAGRERLGQDGMVTMVRRQLTEGLRGESLLRAAVSEVRQLNGGELTDDVAVVLLERG